MIKNNGPENTGAVQNRFDTASLLSKSNTELLDAIAEMMSRPTEDVDTDFVDACLDILQDRAPVMADYDPQAALEQFRLAHPDFFQMEEGEAASAQSRRDPNRKTLRRYASAFMAAMLCLVLTANAFGVNPVQAFLKWMDDTVLVFSNPSGLMELPPDDPSEYHSLDEALDASGGTEADRVTWIPRDYSLSSVAVRTLDKVTYFTARYEAERGELAIRVIHFGNETWGGTTEREEDGETYIYNNRECYVVHNYDLTKAGWEDEHFSYVVSGQISEEELKNIIESIT